MTPLGGSRFQGLQSARSAVSIPPLAKRVLRAALFDCHQRLPTVLLMACQVSSIVRYNREQKYQVADRSLTISPLGMAVSKQEDE